MCDSHKQLSDGVFTAYTVGLVFASVCTTLPDEQATTRMNELHPTGIGSRWQIADQPFANGDPNGSPCDQCPEAARHLLFEC